MSSNENNTQAHAPDTQEGQQSRVEWMKEQYNKQYESWMPWMEDQYLKWFTKDNKTSYGTKQQLDKTKVTGIDQVDNLQDGVNGLVSGQLGKGGIGQPIGDLTSKEGVSRAERGGKDESGGYLGGYGDSAVGGLKSAGGGVANAGKGVGSTVGGWLPGGGGKGEGEEQGKK